MSNLVINKVVKLHFNQGFYLLSSDFLRAL
jgi:hypothetical protein